MMQLLMELASLTRTTLPPSARSLAIPSGAAHLSFMAGPVGLHQLPLLRRQFATNRQKVARIGLFEFRPGLVGSWTSVVANFSNALPSKRMVRAHP